MAIELLDHAGCIRLRLAIWIQPVCKLLLSRSSFTTKRFSHFHGRLLACASRHVWVVIGEKFNLRTLDPQFTLLERLSFFRCFISISWYRTWISSDIGSVTEQFIDQTLPWHFLFLRLVWNLGDSFRAWVDSNSSLSFWLFVSLFIFLNRRRLDRFLGQWLLLLWRHCLFLGSRFFLWE